MDYRTLRTVEAMFEAAAVEKWRKVWAKKVTLSGTHPEERFYEAVRFLEDEAASVVAAATGDTFLGMGVREFEKLVEGEGFAFLFSAPGVRTVHAPYETRFYGRVSDAHLTLAVFDAAGLFDIAAHRRIVTDPLILWRNRGIAGGHGELSFEPHVLDERNPNRTYAHLIVSGPSAFRARLRLHQDCGAPTDRWCNSGSPFWTRSLTSLRERLDLNADSDKWDGHRKARIDAFPPDWKERLDLNAERTFADIGNPPC